MYEGKFSPVESANKPRRKKSVLFRRDWSGEAYASTAIAIAAISAAILSNSTNVAQLTALILLGGVACLLSGKVAGRATAAVIVVVLAIVVAKEGFVMDKALLVPMALITCEGMSCIRQRIVSAERAANVDDLTGALTVRGFARVLSRELSLAHRDNRVTALIFIDLDHFKMVNDNFGHAAGDNVLCELVGNLKSRLLQNDHIARIGGDEFLVFLRYANDSAKIASFQNKMLQAVSDLPYNLTASAGGLILPPKQYGDPTKIIGSADDLMYEVKNSGRGNIRFDTMAA